MLIEKIKQVYKKKPSDEEIIRELKEGKQVMFYHYEPSILLKLNLAIDWEWSKVPEGEEKELNEGDTFMFDGRPQIISIVDENTIKLITSDTGPFALERIVKEIINPEIKMSFKDITNLQASWEIIDEVEAEIITKDENFGYEVIPYEQYRIIKDRLLPGRENILDPKMYMIKVNICGGYIPFPTDFYLNRSGIFYDKDFYEEDEIEYVVSDIFAWLYKNVQTLGRHEFETEKAERKAKEQKELMEKLLNDPDSPLNQGMQNQGCSGNCSNCSNPCTNPNKNLQPNP